MGVEAIGAADADLDVEVISLADDMFCALGLSRYVLKLNSMGDDVCRPAYIETLRAALSGRRGELCAEHRERYSANPLRVLDCKAPECVAATAQVPRLVDSLCGPCAEHFGRVGEGLGALGIAWDLDHRLVRGFDYYTRTTFEFVSDALESAQNAIGGGGRYDGLAEQLGGKPTSGIGFGSGIERLLIVRDAEGVEPLNLVKRSLDAFVIDTTGEDAATSLVDELRRAGLAADRAYDNRSMKAQMKVADKSGAPYALLIGPAELAAGEVTIRDLRSDDFEQTQRRVARGDVAFAVTELLTKS
jgi:histidyl-tRNA synthetase